MNSVQSLAEASTAQAQAQQAEAQAQQAQAQDAQQAHETHQAQGQAQAQLHAQTQDRPNSSPLSPRPAPISAATPTSPISTQSQAPPQVQPQPQPQLPLPPLPVSGPASASLPRPDETPPRHSYYPVPAAHLGHSGSPPLRKDTSSSASTQATMATLASTEANNSSYSADTSPSLHQSIFSIKDGASVSNSRRPSRRRTGPLSQQSRERAALIRKLGACHDCRRRRVACHPSHHNLTWEDVVSKFRRSNSPSVQEMAPQFMAGRPLSPATPLSSSQAVLSHDSQEMDIDTTPPAHHQPTRQPLSDARIRTPLPSGPRLEKSLSLPGIESLKNDLQTSASQMLSVPSRGRYSAVQALLLYWQDDDDVDIVQGAVSELADVFDKYYHYTFQIQTIPPSSDGYTGSWRWLSRQLNEFAEDRDQRDVLKIIYYVGHTYVDGNREMILASSKDKEKASTIRWGGIQQIFEEACSDTLIMMDAAYFPSSRMARQKGVLELIAASASDEHFHAMGCCAFTRALAEQLRNRATRLNPLSAVELHSILLASYPKMAQDQNANREPTAGFPTPLHTMVSGSSRLPSIFLSPVYPASPPRNSFSYENSPQLHLSFKLNDDNVDLDSWNDWLRLMPEGIKDVKIEGPFRAAFR